MHQGSPEAAAAEAHYGAAMTFAAENEMLPLAAHCNLGFGRLYRKTGKDEPAREHMTAAVEMYSEMGMPFWLEQAQAELKSLG